jgi:TatA/E family protein of Tat protein translocase
MTELLVILVVGLLVLGPKKLPELARSLGRGLAEFRRASSDMRREFLDVTEEVRREPTNDSAREASEPAKTPPATTAPALPGSAEPGRDAGDRTTESRTAETKGG